MVVKVGTSTVTDSTGKPSLQRLERLTREIAQAVHGGYEVILVTSGAVGAGMSRLGLDERPNTTPEKQAVAAVGQGLLMQTYEDLFSTHGHMVAQVLLTQADITDRHRHLNARNALLTLLQYGCIPIVNENDAVAVAEIEFGDNDKLSALVAGLVGADLLVMFSDVDGVYDRDPSRDRAAAVIPLIKEIGPDLEAAAGGPRGLGRGGMQTKLQAARLAMRSGTPMVIAHGDRPGALGEILRGAQIGTLFVPERDRLALRKRWIAFFQKPRGELRIDEGACRALVEQGRSLLPVGILEALGDFSQGDLVRVIDHEGNEIGRGLVNYGAGEVDRIKGVPSAQIAARLGQKMPEKVVHDEVIHRDNLVVSAGWNDREGVKLQHGD